MSIAIDIADAVAAELNAAEAGTFSEAFEARRRVLPEFELEHLAALKVTVVPKRVEITGSTRSASQYEIAVDVGVQKKLGKDLDAEVAALGTLVDEIKTAFLTSATVRLAVLTGASDASGTEGPLGDFSITNFSRNEPLEEGVTVSVTAKLAVFDSWVEVA